MPGKVVGFLSLSFVFYLLVFIWFGFGFVSERVGIFFFQNAGPIQLLLNFYVLLF